MKQHHDAEYVRVRLRAEAVAAGGQRALARKIGISVQFLNSVILGHDEPAGKLLEHLRLRRRMIYEPY